MKSAAYGALNPHEKEIVPFLDKQLYLKWIVVSAPYQVRSRNRHSDPLRPIENENRCADRLDNLIMKSPEGTRSALSCVIWGRAYACRDLQSWR